MKQKANKYLLLLLLLTLNNFLFSQISNSTVKIKQVNIYDKKNIKETAIIKHKIDSNILAEETNNSLAEILSKYTPVFIKNYGKTSLSTVSIRGTATSHTDVLWNGISLKSPMLGQVDFSLIPNNIFNKISINYGGSSIANTSGALGGNININNIVDWNNKLSAIFIQDFGSYTTINDFLQINAGNKNFQSSTKLYNNYSKNDFSFKNKNIADIDTATGKYIYPVQKNKNAEFSQQGFMQSLNYKKNKFIVSLDYWYQKTNRSLPRLNTYEGNDYSNINEQTNINNNLIFKTKYYKSKHKIILTSAFVNKNINYSLKNYISGTGYNLAVNSSGTSNSYYNKLSYEYKPSTNSLFTANYAYNFHNVITNETIKNNGYNKTRNEQLLNISFIKKINKRFSLNTILRQNIIDNKFIPLIPFLGLDFLISTKHNLHLKTTLSRNYNLASLNDLYWQPGGNPDLKPEESKSADITLESTKEINNLKLKLSGTYYYSEIKNWIIWLPSPLGYWSPYNIKTVNSQGSEINLQIQYKINKIKIFFNANYAYTNSVNKGDSTFWGESYNKQLPYIPKHSGNIFTSINYKNFYINYTYNSYSERYTSSSQNVSLRDWLYPYFMNNMSLGKIFKYNKIYFDLKLKIYNLFNEEYRTVLGRPMPGRNYLIQLKIKFI